MADALERLADLTDGVPVVMAVNQEYAERGPGPARRRRAGADPAGLRRRSVGTAAHVRVTDEPLQSRPAARAGPRPTRRRGRDLPRRDPGGRPSSTTRPTRRWPRRQIAEIVAAAIERHGLCAAAAEHRVGVVPLSEPSVAVAASAPHRDAAFARRPGDHRRDQGPGADLEEGGGRMGARARRRRHRHRAEGAPRRPRAGGGARGARTSLAVAAARRAIEEHRAAVLAGQPAGRADLHGRAPASCCASSSDPRCAACINATGVILHTNLGRAPLAAAAREAVTRAAAGYSNLELDLDTGERGSRQAHVEELLCELTGAEAAMVVNNGAAAVLLAAAALAGPGRAIVVSRGQLVEIGGGFRIPEVIAPVRGDADRGGDDQPHPASRLRARRSGRTPRSGRSCASTSRTSARSGSSRRCRSRRCASSGSR